MGVISRWAPAPIPEETVANAKRLIELVAKTPDDVLRALSNLKVGVEVFVFDEPTVRRRRPFPMD